MKRFLMVMMVWCAMFCLMMVATFAWALPGIPNGTVTDGNLVWLQNANCFGDQTWNQAMLNAASLKSGSCGLTDGSKAGQWRLPTKDELVRRQQSQQGFNNIQGNVYWSSSTYEGTSFAYSVNMSNGKVGFDAKGHSFYVWPVRSRQ